MTRPTPTLASVATAGHVMNRNWMGNRAGWILAGGILLACGAGWVVTRSGQPHERPEVLAPEAEWPADPTRANPTPWMDRSDNSRELASKPTLGGPPPADVVETSSKLDRGGSDPEDSRQVYDLPIYHWEGDFPEMPPEVYAEKYHGMDRDELEKAKDDLTRKFGSEVRALFSEKVAQDEFSTYLLEYRTGEDGVKEPIGMNLSLSGNTPLFSMISSQDSSGNEIRDFIWLPPDAARYYDLYLEMDELQWLSGTLFLSGATDSDSK